MALFTALAALVASGALSGADQWSVDHLMPGLGPASSSTSLLNSAFPIFDPDKQRGHEVAAAVTYGIVWIASAIPAMLLVGGAAVILWRRGRRGPAIALLAWFLLANVVEIVGKRAIARPRLFDRVGSDTFPIVPFDHSFASGHEIRAVVLAACLVTVASGLWPLALAWLCAVTIVLVTGGWHTPTDVLGGLLVAVGLGAAAFGCAQALEHRRRGTEA